MSYHNLDQVTKRFRKLRNQALLFSMLSGFSLVISLLLITIVINIRASIVFCTIGIILFVIFLVVRNKMDN